MACCHGFAGIKLSYSSQYLKVCIIRPWARIHNLAAKRGVGICGIQAGVFVYIILCIYMNGVMPSGIGLDKLC